MGCLESSLQFNVSNQGECQDNCKANDTCVGISYSHRPGFTNHCFACTNDILTNVTNNFDFYRKPGKNDLSVNVYTYN